MDDITVDDLKNKFPGGLADQIAALHTDDGAVTSETDGQEATATEEKSVEPVAKNAEAATKEEPQASPVSDRLADAIDKLSERLDQGKQTEQEVPKETKKTLLEELGVQFPDLDSEEIAKVFEDNGLSPEVKALFLSQQKAFADALSKIGEKQAVSIARAEEVRVAAANRMFWDGLKSKIPDYDQYVTPDGIHGKDAKATKVTEDWLAKQPEFIAEAAKEALSKGNVNKLSGLISSIKEHQAAQGAQPPDAVAKKIKAAEETAVKQPQSISSIPGTAVPPDAADEVEHASDKLTAARRYHGGSVKKMKELLDKVLTV